MRAAAIPVVVSLIACGELAPTQQPVAPKPQTAAPDGPIAASVRPSFLGAIPRARIGKRNTIRCELRDGRLRLLFATLDTKSAIARFDGEEVVLDWTAVPTVPDVVRWEASFVTGGTELRLKSYRFVDSPPPGIVPPVYTATLHDVVVHVTRDRTEWRFTAQWACRIS